MAIQQNKTDMKPITIEGEKFEYERMCRSYNGKVYTWTSFYQGMEIKSHKKYWLFGRTIDENVPKLEFTLSGIDIEDSQYTKEQIKGKIMEALAKRNRRKEIEKGEIV